MKNYFQNKEKTHSFAVNFIWSDSGLLITICIQIHISLQILQWKHRNNNESISIICATFKLFVNKWFPYFQEKKNCFFPFFISFTEKTRNLSIISYICSSLFLSFSIALSFALSFISFQLINNWWTTLFSKRWIIDRMPSESKHFSLKML